MLRQTTVVPVRLIGKGGFRLGRRVGLTRMSLFGAGVVAGLFAAREPGRELRQRTAQRVRREWDQRSGPKSDEELASRVRDELSQAPRTWHLPQPDVEIVERKAILSGTAPHAAGKADIEQVVAGVKGVADVDNRLVIGSQ